MRCCLVLALCVVCVSATDSRVPPEVRFKRGYINAAHKPENFTSAMLWGIAIADTRVRGYERAQVEIAHTRLSCRVDGADVVLNDDQDDVRGGLYRRFPWFGTESHADLPMAHSSTDRAIILGVGNRPDVVWHFWAASARASLPAGHLSGCTVSVRAKISRGALLQVGFDYWRNPSVGYGSGGNNHEAGASDWYFPSDRWQEASFSDIKEAAP